MHQGTDQIVYCVFSYFVSLIGNFSMIGLTSLHFYLILANLTTFEKLKKYFKNYQNPYNKGM